MLKINRKNVYIFIAQLPDVSPKVESFSSSNSKRQAATTGKLNIDHFSTPSEFLEFAEPIAKSTCTEHEQFKLIKEQSRSLGSKTSPTTRKKRKKESRVATSVNDYNRASSNRTGCNKWYNRKNQAKDQRLNVSGTICLLRS